MEIRFILPRRGPMGAERDRFLSEAMGTCFHEYEVGKLARICSINGFVCRKCGVLIFSDVDFTTAEDFVKLLDWAKDEKRTKDFVAQFAEKDFLNDTWGAEARKRFADGLYELLVRKKRKGKYAKRQGT